MYEKLFGSEFSLATALNFYMNWIIWQFWMEIAEKLQINSSVDSIYSNSTHNSDVENNL